MKLFDEIKQRGLIENTTSEELAEKINAGDVTFYVGFDPTGDSLHVGHFAILNLMRLLQKGGHRPIGVMGGGTGMIGDPGGRSKERNLLTQDQIEKNINGIQKQLAQFLDFKEGNKAKLVNNYEWLSALTLIDFLRDIGKYFSVSTMITRDSVKSRLDREGEGISYTEFSYMLLQAYDFYKLNEDYECTLQIGGSDQWGNIVSGIDLTRRINNNQLYGITMPLITKADGNKFGKSESGAIFLSADKTSPYEFYQFFLRQADEDVIRFLKVFTELSLEEIAEFEVAVKVEPHKRIAQKKLAEEATRSVHGQAILVKVVRASNILFGEKIEQLDDQIISEIFKDVPSLKKEKGILQSGYSLIDALVETQACKSNGQARKLIQSGGAYVNNVPQMDIEYKLTTIDLAAPSFLILRSGKKNYQLIHLQ
ncbi:MAG: tyrosine--tRNA ligase [SAR324 cluster bacterium]|nr:tyrosine--tRNA ligase [SAR324 cluster bacterium]